MRCFGSFLTPRDLSVIELMLRRAYLHEPRAERRRELISIVTRLQASKRRRGQRVRRAEVPA